MLELNIKEQFKNIFENLESEITLAFPPSAHEKQNELEELLGDVAGTSPRLTLKKSGENAPVPSVSLEVNGRKTGVTFSRISGRP